MSRRPYVAWVGGGLRRYAVLEVRVVLDGGDWVARAIILSRHFTHRGADKRRHAIFRARRSTP